MISFPNKTLKGIPDNIAIPNPINRLFSSFESNLPLRKFFLLTPLEILLLGCSEKTIKLNNRDNLAGHIALFNYLEKQNLLPYLPTITPRTLQESKKFPHLSEWIKWQVILTTKLQSATGLEYDHVIKKCVEKKLLVPKFHCDFYILRNGEATVSIYRGQKKTRKRKSYGLKIECVLYKPEPQLIDLWLKAETTTGGLFELWIFYLAKKVVQQNKLPFDVHYSVTVKPNRNPEDFAELDVVLQHKRDQNKILAIECKTQAGLNDAKKFWGINKVLGIPKNILVTSSFSGVSFSKTNPRVFYNDCILFSRICDSDTALKKFVRVLKKTLRNFDAKAS